MRINRRHILAQISALTGFALTAGRSLARTPSATEGPYYPRPNMRRADVDNDLVKIAGAVQEAGGEVIELTGRIATSEGTPLAGLRIEIWQCDMNGNYMHPRDSRSANFDPAFQGFGHDITDAAGRYRFRTIKPTIYPGRTPHIHVKVFEDGTERLTTQFYIRDHPANARDGLFRRMSAENADAVSMDFQAGPNGPVANVDVTL